MENQNLSIFEGVKIRQIEHDGETYYSIIDIIVILTDSPQPTSYWNKVRKQIEKENQLLPIWQKFKFLAPDGKMRPTDCANTEGVFRIIQSIPSPKAEPFKMWLASLGKQAIDEANDPELLTEKQIQLYKAKGYTDEWIERRIKTIEIRKELTNEWKNRGVKEGQEYSILTSTIAKGTFGLSPNEHANLKGLEKENLRDHMTTLELLFTALGEELTRDETTKTDAQGFNESFDAAQRGGFLAGKARKAIESETGKTIVSKDNFLGKGEERKALEEGEKD
jgi:DNA-damage-inducible protein D